MSRRVNATASQVEEALSKQIPQEPIWEEKQFGERLLVCPCCKNPATDFYSGKKVTPSYCPYCGQKLGWGGF